jgi:hypothetical protein
MSRWTDQMDERLAQLVTEHGQDWNAIHREMKDRSVQEIAARWTTALNRELIKEHFVQDEGDKIVRYVSEHGEQSWSGITSVVTTRTLKQCRERWFDHLSPDVSNKPWTDEEDAAIFELFQQYGTKWSLIALALPGRTDNAVKNRYNSSISKRIEPDVTGAMILTSSKARRYVQKCQKRIPKRDALAQQRPPALAQPAAKRLAKPAQRGAFDDVAPDDGEFPFLEQDDSLFADLELS